MGDPAPQKAWSVKRLAAQWGCSRTTIYTMIEEGRLKAFPLGTRGLRIKDEERIRCENSETSPSSPMESTDSENGEAKLLPVTTMKMISAGVRG